jgi:hypothetical protein
VNQIRKRLTYANVMSSIAVFLVLGGATAFAATQLGKNTVGTKQLKKNAVTGVKVKDGSLTAADFKPGQLPAGAPGKEGKQGPEGKQGQQGPIGPSDLYSAEGPFKTLATGEVKFTLASVTVPAGSYQVIASQTAQPFGGGAELDCFIFAGSTEEASFYTKLASGTDGNVTGMATLVLTEPTVVADKCTAFENSVIVPEPKIVALKVGTVH